MAETPINPALAATLADYLLSVADDKLILGHRNSDWTGLGPILEEDIAFSSLAQDEIAHAQALYQLVSKLAARSPDDLAFGRTANEYRCASIVELPDEFDWATAIVRQFFCDHFDHLRLQMLAGSSWKPLADLSKRLAAEEQVHVEHVDQWIVRLGRGTEESREHVQRALHALREEAVMLHEPVEDQEALEEAGLIAIDRGRLFDEWHGALKEIAKQAGLELNVPNRSDARGGRRGKHTSHLEELLAEMSEVYRLEPGAAW